MLRAICRYASTLPLVLVSLASYGGDSATLRSEFIAGGFTQPLFVTAVPGDASRLFVVEKGGLIRIIKNGAVLPTPFLDLRSVVVTDVEEGLLGLAFDPNFSSNGRFYVNFVVNGATIFDNDSTKIARFTVTANPEVADPASRTDLLSFEQPFQNHNGGMMAFGPNDGFLYIATGDGGFQNDPANRAQQLTTYLGKMLRIDVSGAGGYAVPPSNPFVNQGGNLPEIWAYGLRNPWRFSFDRTTGDLWIADVGQDAREEVNFQAAASNGGQNYGWKVAEGFVCRGGTGTCGTNPGFTPPLLDYGRSEGQSITGGYVYRGQAMADFQGVYLYADFQATRVWSLRRSAQGAVTELTERTSQLLAGEGSTIQNIASFGEDGAGELYIVSYGSGEIFKIRDASSIGDVDGNGVANAIDVQLVINAALGLSVTFDTDLNNDGDTNAADVQFVINAALGLG